MPLDGSQRESQRPECPRVVGVDNVRDFVPERVHCFRPAVFAKRLIADDNPMPRGLVIAAVGFAPRDHNLRRGQPAREVDGIEPRELGLKLSFQAVNDALLVGHRPRVS